MFLIDGSHIQSHPVTKSPNFTRSAGWLKQLFDVFFSIGFAAPAAAHASRDSLDLLDTSSAPRSAVHKSHDTNVTRHHTVQDTTTRRHIVVSRHVSKCLVSIRPVSHSNVVKHVVRHVVSVCFSMFRVPCFPPCPTSPGPVALPPRLDLPRLADPGLKITVRSVRSLRFSDV